LFFFFAMFAGTGTALPVVAYLNYFFPAKAPATQKIILRQASWFGIYGCVILWLAVGRVLSIQVATVIFFGLLIFEFVLRLREFILRQKVFTEGRIFEEKTFLFLIWNCANLLIVSFLGLI